MNHERSIAMKVSQSEVSKHLHENAMILDSFFFHLLAK